MAMKNHSNSLILHGWSYNAFMDFIHVRPKEIIFIVLYINQK